MLEGIKSLNEIKKISPEIHDFLMKEGFSNEKESHYYCDLKSPVLYHKYLHEIPGKDCYIAYITKNEIGLEQRYDYGGGASYNIWKFLLETEDFVDAYNEFVEAVERLIHNEY